MAISRDLMRRWFLFNCQLADTSLADFYSAARSEVISRGYRAERDWQAQLSHECFSEADLLREGAWVILCSGFKERYVRSVFSFISLCFCDWENSLEINRNREICRKLALGVFNNRRKIDAILRMSEMIEEAGFDNVRSSIRREPIEFLQVFPMIGGITAKHLAKNLGFPVAKADRHLVRIAHEHGYHCVDTFCKAISDSVQECVSVVDVTLWRYSVLRAEIRS